MGQGCAHVSSEIRNSSRSSQRPNAPYSPQVEFRINTRAKPTLTLDQLQRFTAEGVHASYVPPGSSDITPNAAMRYSDKNGNPVDWRDVASNIAKALRAAEACKHMDKALGETAKANPVESVIAYARNRRAQEQNQSLQALNTDLVKFSVLGFQIGADRDRATMATLESMIGKLGEGLSKPRDVKNDNAVFELSIRKLPDDVPYLAIAGVRDAIDYVYNQLEFNEEVIQFFKTEIPSTKGWTDEHWNYLRGGFKEDLKKLKISGLPDGSIYVGGPLLKIEGPAKLCEFIETAVMARISSMTQHATAMALIKEVYQGATMEAGGRRPPSADSLSKDVEACCTIADITTSHVLTQYLPGVRAAGTMEHSAIMLSGVEAQTLFFVQWFLMYGKFSTALVDSRSPEEGVRAVVEAQTIIDTLKPTLENDPAYKHITGWRIPSIRLDSGELRPQIKKFRKVLDDAGMRDCGITVMDGMIADKLKHVIHADGEEIRVDAIGTGECLRFPAVENAKGETTRFITGMIYKASRLFHGDEALDLMKNSATTAKATRPSRSLYRIIDANGRMVSDVAGYDDVSGKEDMPKAPPGGRVVNRLVTFAENGTISPTLTQPLEHYWKETRARFSEELGSLALGWRERDEARKEGRPWRPEFRESRTLLGVVEQLTEAMKQARDTAESKNAAA